MNQTANTLVAERFLQLKTEWEERTQFMSSVTQMAADPAYGEIIAMGEGALPFILQTLRDDPGHWFWALTAISGEDQASGIETFNEAREKWLNWGVQEGYLV